MPKTTLSYKDTGYFSRLMCDYLSEEEGLESFYNRFPKLENFQAQFEEKADTFSKNSREVLVKQLMHQYKNFDVSEATLDNIKRLSEENTFTITTGHQLNLFTGPLYFLYKIFSVINLSEKLNSTYPKQHFVPVYWMATEDHDFEEINYFNLFGKKIKWDRLAAGAVGELSTEGLAEVAKLLQEDLGSSEHGSNLLELFTEAYTKHQNLAAATRFLGNELFKEYGLVIIDGNDAQLKRAFIPFAERELTENISFKNVNETTERLVSRGYAEQVHAREINLFYLTDGLRERIIEKDGRFHINNTELNFSQDEILKQVQDDPQKFSPNALLRPLYQEVILPNLCYVGGGGELAYWFQLKDYFASVNVPFPMLLLRNSALLVTSKLSEKIEKLGVSIDDIFQKQHDLQGNYTKKISEIDIDFSKQKEHLHQQFREIYELANQTDPSFVGAVGAQEKKQLNGLSHLEKRLLKAQKRKFADRLERLTAIQDELFPNKTLQERSVNFSQFYLEYGRRLLLELKESLDPLAQEFTVIEI